MAKLIDVEKTTRAILNGISSDDFRVCAIEGLRQFVRGAPAMLKQPEWAMHGQVGVALVPPLAKRAGLTAEDAPAQELKEPFLTWQGDPDMQPLTDFLSWFVRVGFALPIYRNWPAANGYLSGIRLTSAGRRFLEKDEGDHPYLPGFVDRVVARCPGLPDEVSVLLADAQTCAENRLGRPAVVLAGVAYEAAAECAIERVNQLAKVAEIKKSLKAAQRIAAMKERIPHLLPEIEERSRALEAWDFADRLRDRRNQGSHPKAFPDFSDLDEVHEYLLSAGRHLPGLWSVTAG